MASILQPIKPQNELLVWDSHWLRAGYYVEGFVLHLGLVEEFNVIPSVAALFVYLFENSALHLINYICSSLGWIDRKKAG